MKFSEGIKKEFFNNGVPSFEIKEIPGYNITSGEICSRVWELDANSCIGVLEKEVYRYPLDKTQDCYDLFKYNLMVVCRKYLEGKTTSEEEIQSDSIIENWFYGSPLFLNDGAVKVKTIIDYVLKKYGCNEIKSSICLAFPQSVLWLEKEKLESVNALVEFGIKTCLTDVGERLCPITIVSELQVNYVALSDACLKWQNETTKKQTSLLIDYLKADGKKIYAKCKDCDRDDVRRLGVDAYWIEY